MDYPEKTGCKNILLIDKNVMDTPLLMESTNSNTLPILYSCSKTRDQLLALLRQKFTTIERIGILFTQGNANLFLNHQHFFVQENVDFLVNLIKEFKVSRVDFLACNTLQYDAWKLYFARILESTGIVVGASNNKTGNIQYGGDWIMENTMEDIQNIYFTQNIQYYKYVLDLGDFTAVIVSGEVWVTGTNNSGQLGMNTYDNLSVFTKSVTAPPSVSMISCGANYTLLLTTSGHLWGTGSNYYGQIGLPNGSDYVGYAAVIDPFNIKAIACGAEHSFLLTETGELWATGRNHVGQLGLAGGDRTAFEKVTVSKTFKQVVCGDSYTVAVTTDGELWGTGKNNVGQLGMAHYNDVAVFTKSFTAPVSVSMAACGNAHTLCLTTTGQLWGTGGNLYGPLGVSGNQNKIVYSQAVAPSNIKNIACGYEHSLLLTETGEVWGTGLNTSGQLGIDGTYTEFTKIPDFLFGSISCGKNHSLGLINGVLWGTGHNDAGQLGVGGTHSSFTQILTGVSYLPGAYTIVVVVSTICFPATTLIKTDQGRTEIQKLIAGYHTIGKKDIVAITETYSMDSVLVCIEKNALRKNYPNVRTILSKRHKLYYRGCMIAAHRLVGKPGVSFIPYRGEKLYNVLLEDYGKMNVHGMMCETLNPMNPVAGLFRPKIKTVKTVNEMDMKLTLEE